MYVYMLLLKGLFSVIEGFGILSPVIEGFGILSPINMNRMEKRKWSTTCKPGLSRGSSGCVPILASWISCVFLF